MRIWAGSIWIAAMLSASSLVAQQSTRPAVGAGGPFSFNGVAPISPAAVIHVRMDAAPDSGAVLGYVISIRGAPNWWNRKTKFGTIPPDSLPPGVSGEHWLVGDVAYTFRYDSAQKRLTIFGTELDLRKSRVVLVTLGVAPTDAVRVELGSPMVFAMRTEEDVIPLFLSRSPEVRAFAGLK